MKTLLYDIRHSLRLLRRNKVFTGSLVATLAIAVAASATVFSVAWSYLLRPLPFENGDRLVILRTTNARQNNAEADFSPANFLDFRQQSGSFDQLAAINPWSFDYSGDGGPEVLNAGRVTKGFFETLGVRALHGRTFSTDEYDSADRHVVMLSHDLWRRKFGADPSIVGQSLRLSKELYTVVGVLPPEFRIQLYENEEEIWSTQFM